VYNSRIEPMSPQQAAPETPVRPRSRARLAFRYALVTGTIGALAVVVAAQTGGAHWSLRAISWLVFGFCFGAVFGPLFALAREPDGDAPQGVAPVQGNSDTSFEGAQAHDLRRPSPGGP
jgi:hypothetical protein